MAEDFQMPFQMPDIHFSISRDLSPDGSVEDYIVNVPGSIYLEDEEELGSFYGHIIQVDRALNEEQYLFEACDAHSHSQTLTQYYEALFDFDSDEIKESITKQWQKDVLISSDILIVDRVEVRPEYRGHGLGLAAVYSFIETFGKHDGFVALTPYPFQFDYPDIDQKPFEKFSRDKKVALQKLQKYWSRLGVQRLEGATIGGTPIYGWPLCLTMPSLAEVLSKK